MRRCLGYRHTVLFDAACPGRPLEAKKSLFHSLFVFLPGASLASGTAMSSTERGCPNQGGIFTEPSCPGLTPVERAATYAAMAATLAALHSVQPAAVGLARFGRPSGYCKRQVRCSSRLTAKSGLSSLQHALHLTGQERKVQSQWNG